jgi:gluconolactonase
VIALDKRFSKYVINNAAIERLWTGARWAEGPAWSGDGRFLLWSDIPNNRQMRWLEEDGHVSAFRSPSDYSNGNTFDYEGPPDFLPARPCAGWRASKWMAPPR